MQLAILTTRAQNGLEAPPVTVEVCLTGGLPGFHIVGLPATAVRESRDRVRAALSNSGLEFPDGKVICNLAPADLPKDGGRYDLAIAVGIAAARDQVPAPDRNRYELFGELGLDGELRAFRGALPTAAAVARAGHAMILPQANAAEAALVRDACIYPANSLAEVRDHLKGLARLPRLTGTSDKRRVSPRYPDLADVRAQFQARRALEIAAAGSHSLLMTGPPGTGKTMLAARMPGLLPLMDDGEAMETASLESLGAAPFDPDRWGQRPFRSPHHTASAVALVGGGSTVLPGEISLAHNGVLFLDELPEFDRRVLEALRQPLEEGRVLISRAARHATYPARFQLIAAMNPCPCGYRGDPGRDCRCPPGRIAAYQGRISGPLLDRFDLTVHVPRPPQAALASSAPPGESTAAVAARVARARRRQQARGGTCNARLEHADCARHCEPDRAGAALIERTIDRMRLSPRAYHRTLKVARTIADLEGDVQIREVHVAEALSFRSAVVQ